VKTRPLSIALAVVLALLLVLAICRLYVLRFQVGDVYPPYSSLRADPLGTKVLYASLQNLPEVEASRIYRDPEPAGRETRRTLLLLGVPSDLSVRDDDINQLKGLAASGDRIVIAFLPVQKAPEKPKKSDATPTPSPSPEAEDEQRSVSTSLGDEMDQQFGCAFAYLKTKKGDELEATAVSSDFEANVPWNSVLYFVSTKSGWHPLYKVNGRPVAVERNYGHGSIVLLSDAYLFSNEALREHRSPRFLAVLIGGSRQVLFDEAVHGLQESTGIAGLLRKYHLEPVLTFAMLLAALFAWQNMSPLVPMPAPSGAREESEVTGRDAIAGRINLLRRSVPPSALIAQCLRRWENSAGRRLAHRPQLLEKIREQAAFKAPPAQVYQAITTTLDRDRHSTVNPVNPVNPV